jgi:Bacterial SH3 domain
LEKASVWFDELSNLQAASFLVGLLCTMLGIAACLIVASMMLEPAPIITVSAPSAAPAPAPAVSAPAEAPERTVPLSVQIERTESALSRAAIVASTVNLRAEPSTASRSLAVLPAHTDLMLLGDTAQAGSTLWQHVRTDDEREGWIIGTALD